MATHTRDENGSSPTLCSDGGEVQTVTRQLEMMQRLCKHVSKVQDDLRAEMASHDAARADLRDAHAHIDILEQQIHRLDISVKLATAESQQTVSRNDALSRESAALKQRLEQDAAEYQASREREVAQVKADRDVFNTKCLRWGSCRAIHYANKLIMPTIIEQLLDTRCE